MKKSFFKLLSLLLVAATFIFLWNCSDSYDNGPEVEPDLENKCYLFGKVTDFKGTAISNVGVSVKGASAVTDQYGEYHLSVDPADYYILTYKCDGYLSASKDIVPQVVSTPGTSYSASAVMYKRATPIATSSSSATYVTACMSFTAEGRMSEFVSLTRADKVVDISSDEVMMEVEVPAGAMNSGIIASAYNEDYNGSEDMYPYASLKLESASSDGLKSGNKLTLRFHNTYPEGSIGKLCIMTDGNISGYADYEPETNSFVYEVETLGNIQALMDTKASSDSQAAITFTPVIDNPVDISGISLDSVIVNNCTFNSGIFDVVYNTTYGEDFSYSLISATGNASGLTNLLLPTIAEITRTSIIITKNLPMYVDPASNETSTMSWRLYGCTKNVFYFSQYGTKYTAKGIYDVSGLYGQSAGTSAITVSVILDRYNGAGLDGQPVSTNSDCCSHSGGSGR